MILDQLFTQDALDLTETSDYARRREREEAIISGQKPERRRQPAQTSDYARRREQEKKQEQGVTKGKLQEAGTRQGALNTVQQLYQQIQRGGSATDLDVWKRMMAALQRKYKITDQEAAGQSSQQQTGAGTTPPPGGQQSNRQQPPPPPPGGQQSTRQQPPPPPPGGQSGAGGADWWKQMNQQHGFAQAPNAANPNWFNQHMAASQRMMQEIGRAHV